MFSSRIREFEERLMKRTRIAREIFKQHPLILDLKGGDKNLQGKKKEI